MIRNAVYDDIHQITELHIEFIRHLIRVNSERYSLVPEERKIFLEKLKGLISDKNTLVIVYEEDDCIVGYGIGKVKDYPSFIKNKRYGEVYEVVVKREYQRKGIGSGIVRNLLDFFVSKGLDIAELLVDCKNENAVKSWLNLGFNEEIKIMRKSI